MSKNIWSTCRGTHHIAPLSTSAWRLVEAQEITATRKLVDSLAEQILLEDMLESSKPLLTDNFASYHPLLYTPFRYPPLQYGSRFGNKQEPALWYGSLALDAALAEKAFYKFNFLRASDAEYGLVEERLTAFSVAIKTPRGINLATAPFSRYEQLISSPTSYEASQQLGSAMREADVQAFHYRSARDQQHGQNIALFTAHAFERSKPDAASLQSWQCIADKHKIEFVRSSSLTGESRAFALQEFMVDDRLPFPAS